MVVSISGMDCPSIVASIRRISVRSLTSAPLVGADRAPPLRLPAPCRRLGQCISGRECAPATRRTCIAGAREPHPVSRSAPLAPVARPPAQFLVLQRVPSTFSPTANFPKIHPVLVGAPVARQGSWLAPLIGPRPPIPLAMCFPQLLTIGTAHQGIVPINRAHATTRTLETPIGEPQRNRFNFLLRHGSPIAP